MLPSSIFKMYWYTAKAIALPKVCSTDSEENKEGKQATKSCIHFKCQVQWPVFNIGKRHL